MKIFGFEIRRASKTPAQPKFHDQTIRFDKKSGRVKGVGNCSLRVTEIPEGKKLKAGLVLIDSLPPWRQEQIKAGAITLTYKQIEGYLK